MHLRMFIFLSHQFLDSELQQSHHFFQFRELGIAYKQDTLIYIVKEGKLDKFINNSLVELSGQILQRHNFGESHEERNIIGLLLIMLSEFFLEEEDSNSYILSYLISEIYFAKCLMLLLQNNSLPKHTYTLDVINAVVQCQILSVCLPSIPSVHYLHTQPLQKNKNLDWLIFY